MYRLRLSALAEQDIEEILSHSEAYFGERARLRYETLLEAGLQQIAADPNRAAVRLREDLGPGILTYHLLYAREHARTDHGTVKRPRHLLVFRICSSTLVDVGRVLHDAMELSAHLPTEYARSATGRSDQTDDETG
jgi:toxin ParE1/3/4